MYEILNHFKVFTAWLIFKFNAGYMTVVSPAMAVAP